MLVTEVNNEHGIRVLIWHPDDCDGWRMHSVNAMRLDDGTWVGHCPLCGELPRVGSCGSPETARAVNRSHEAFEPCSGQCHAWPRGENQ